MRKGFTLLELMLVLGVIGILTAIVLVAINPTKQLDDAQGASRNASVREIENAVLQYIIDSNTLTGIPAGMGNAQDICKSTITGAACTDAPVSGYDLAVLIPTYLTSIPIDPDEPDASLTGYRIYITGSFTKVCNTIIDTGCGS